MSSKKTAPNPKIATLRVGNTDTSGNIVTEILAKGNEYVIYEIENKDPEKLLRFMIDGYSDKREDDIARRYNVVKSKYVIAKGLLYRATNFSLMKSRIAHTLATALHSDANAALNQFEALIAEINKDYRTLLVSRVFFLMPGYVSVTILSALLIWNFGASHFQWPSQIWDLLLVGNAALAGGVFSQTFALRSTKFGIDIGKPVFLLLGAERAFLAIIAGFIVYFAIRSNVLLGFLNTERDPIYAQLFAAAVAGFSENYIPGLIEKFVKDN